MRPPVGAERKTVGRRGRAGGGGVGWGGGRCGAGRARAGWRVEPLAWGSLTRPRRSSRADAGRAARSRHVSAPTLHVQSAQVSAPDRNRASAPAADLRAGPDPHAAQG